MTWKLKKMYRLWVILTRKVSNNNWLTMWDRLTSFHDFGIQEEKIADTRENADTYEYQVNPD